MRMIGSKLQINVQTQEKLTLASNLHQEEVGSEVVFISSGDPAMHPHPTILSSKPCMNFLGSWPNLPKASSFFSPTAPGALYTIPGWSQGRSGVPTLYRAEAWAFDWSAVRSSSGLPSFRAGLGPRTYRCQSRPGLVEFSP